MPTDHKIEGQYSQFRLLDGDPELIACGVVISADSCEDSDQGCVYCAGRCTRDSEVTLYRIDMDDLSGTAFCGICAEDALQSGCFRTC